MNKSFLTGPYIFPTKFSILDEFQFKLNQEQKLLNPNLSAAAIQQQKDLEIHWYMQEQERKQKELEQKIQFWQQEKERMNMIHEKIEYQKKLDKEKAFQLNLRLKNSGIID